MPKPYPREFRDDVVGWTSSSIMTKGETVEVKDGTIFDVGRTYKS